MYQAVGRMISSLSHTRVVDWYSRRFCGSLAESTAVRGSRERCPTNRRRIATQPVSRLAATCRNYARCPLYSDGESLVGAPGGSEASSASIQPSHRLVAGQHRVVSYRCILPHDKPVYTCALRLSLSLSLVLFYSSSDSASRQDSSTLATDVIFEFSRRWPPGSTSPQARTNSPRTTLNSEKCIPRKESTSYGVFHTISFVDCSPRQRRAPFSIDTRRYLSPLLPRHCRGSSAGPFVPSLACTLIVQANSPFEHQTELNERRIIPNHGFT